MHAQSIPLASNNPLRSQVSAADCWDLSTLFKDDSAWENAFAKWWKRIPKYNAFRGTLAHGPTQLAKMLEFDVEMDTECERLGAYAFLRVAEDTQASDAQRMLGKFRHAVSEAAETASFIRPEILAIPAKTMKVLLADHRLENFKLKLERMLRDKPHTLSLKEERLLAMQSEMADAAEQVFRQLNDADLRFGSMQDDHGAKIELTHATYTTLLHSPQRAVRAKAFQQYYAQFDAHKHTLAASLAGSIQRDVYYAKVRNHASALDAALFPDNVPRTVYESLIAAVRDRLPLIHRYYEFRRKKMKLRDIHQYDTYTPILPDLEKRHTWEEAVDVVLQSLKPLGADYGKALKSGLKGRWCDRYPNVGKQSGAFSYGVFTSAPYILMNFQEAVLDHVFTLTHEAGHSMHTYLSSRSQPFQYYNYTIFVAEVASTFNEQLLMHHMLKEATDKRERAFLINKELDGIRGTIIRQTMFAEFEKLTHESAESGEPLTLDRFRDIYGELLKAYFGPRFTIDEQLSLECFRIPHFYHAFYVYKYATGLSAAIALSQRVLNGGKQELEAYLGFLKGGSSKDPLDLLKDAGVDMTTPEPINAALNRFESLLGELEELI